MDSIGLILSHPQPRQLQPSLQCGSHGQGQNQHLCTCASLLRGYSWVQPVSYLFSDYSMMLSTKVKWNQHEISNNSCNNEWFRYYFIFFPEHFKNHTWAFAYRTVQSRKSNKRRMQTYTGSTVNRLCVEPLWKTVWLSLN